MGVLSGLLRAISPHVTDQTEGLVAEALRPFMRHLPGDVMSSVGDTLVVKSPRFAGKNPVHTAGFSTRETDELGIPSMGRNYDVSILPGDPRRISMTVVGPRRDPILGTNYHQVNFEGEGALSTPRQQALPRAERARSSVAMMRTAGDLLAEDARIYRPEGYTFWGSWGGGANKDGLNPRDRIYRKMAERLAKEHGYEVTRMTRLRDFLRSRGVQTSRDMNLRRISPVHDALRQVYYPIAGGGVLGAIGYGVDRLRGGED